MDRLSKNIKHLRMDHHMTQQHLAYKLGLTKSVISAYETGLRQPSYDVLINLTKLFNVTSDFLLGINSNQNIDLSGLKEHEKVAIINLIDALKKN